MCSASQAGSPCCRPWGSCPAPLVALMLGTLRGTAHPAEALEVLVQHFAVVQLQAAEAGGMLCQRQDATPRHLIAVAEAQHLQPRQLLQVLQQGGLGGVRPKELLAGISAASNILRASHENAHGC